MRPLSALSIALACVAGAQEIPVPPVRAALPSMPGAKDLPARPEMPDVLRMNDGTRVKTRAQWERRREEIRRVLEYYAVGRMPPAPGNVKGNEVQAESVLDGGARYRLIHLTFGPASGLSLNVGVFTPSGSGPFAAIILQSGTPPGATALPRLPPGANQGKGLDVLSVVGPAPNAAPPTAPPVQTAEATAMRYKEVLGRGYALVFFNPNDCGEDTTLRNQDGSWAFRDTRFFPAYPGYDWGILGSWAWGASRVADYLVTDQSIDKARLIITGASRYGKAAMVAAAFDERLMGAPVVTGGGGIGAYRFAGPRKSETLDMMETKYPNWFSPQLRDFRGQREKLPFDQHWFLALCAPRPFIALEGDTDTISLPEAVRQSVLGAAPAYALFSAKEKLGVNYANHGHAFTAEDWTALMDFADQQLLGKKVERTFDRFPSDEELDAAATAVAVRTTAQESPERVLQRAAELHQAGDVEQAIPQYRAYLKMRPDSVEARSNLGVALVRAGRYGEAVVEYRAAMQRRPGDRRIRLNLALALYKLGQIGDAAKELVLLHREQPAEAQVLLLLADCRLRQGDNKQVIELLSPAGVQNQNDLAIAYLLGTALLRDKQTERAQPMIDRILRNGESAEARLLLGTAKLEALDFDGAVVEFEKAAAANAQLPEVHSYLGQAHMQTGDTAAARVSFQQELALNPNDFESNLQLAALLRNEQDYGGARVRLERALLVRPGDLRARFQLGSLHVSTGGLDQGRVVLEAVVKQAPEFIEAHVLLASVYYRMGRKADGDREKATAQRLTMEERARGKK